jgi:phosphatidyl-myo-inositol dimannoside synthase
LQPLKRSSQINSPKLRVLLITRNLPPLIGGMERLLLHIAQSLAEFTQLTVIGPKGCKDFLPECVETVEVSEKLSPFIVASVLKSVGICRAAKFDLVIGGSGLLGPNLRILSLLFNIKTMIYLHGLDLVVDSFIYQRVFTPSLRTLNTTLVNSQNTRKIAIEKGIHEERIFTINPGTQIPEIPDRKILEQFRADFDIPFKRNILFVGRMTKRKGLSQFIKFSLKSILDEAPEAGLIVVGENPKDSLNKMGEENEVVETISALDKKTQNRIVFLGQLSNQDLVSCYATSDVLIFPLVETPGDIEGFGMVAIEAAALGTSTVAFDTGGIRDAVSSQNGKLIPTGQYELFSSAVIDSLRNQEPDSSSCIAHAEMFSWEIFETKLRTALNKTSKQHLN